MFSSFNFWVEFVFNYCFFLQFIQILLEIDCQIGQIGCVQCCYFVYFWMFDMGVEDIGLELYQEVVSYCVVVYVQGVQMNVGVSLYCFQYVVGLKGDGFQCCMDNVVGVYVVGEVENCVVGIWVLVWCVKIGECGYYVYVVGIFYFGGEVFGVEGIVDEFYFVVQLLNRCVGYKYCFFQSVVYFVVWVVGDGGQQIVGGGDCFFVGIYQYKVVGVVGVFCYFFFDVQLVEQGCLLVIGDFGDRNMGFVFIIDVGLVVYFGRFVYFWQYGVWNVQCVEYFVVLVEVVNVEQYGM